MASNKFRHSFAIIAIIATSWSLMATSDDAGNTWGSFHVHSDCVSPTVVMDIYVSGTAISTPGGTDFTDLGFPSSNVSLGSTVSGTYGGQQRRCEKVETIGNDDLGLEDSYLYSCSDDGQFKCNIYLENND